MRMCRYVSAALLLLPLSAHAQDLDLRLDRPTPSELEPFVQRLLDSATRSLDRILAVQGQRTVENTLRPYDDSRLVVNRGRIVSTLSDLHPDSAIRAAAARAELMIGAYNVARRSDERIYGMLRAVDTSRADAETRFWVRQELRNYELQFGHDSVVRSRARALRRELIRLGQVWSVNPRYDTMTVIFDAAELEGLPDAWLRARRRSDGKIHVSGDEMRPIMSQAALPATREKAMRASLRPRRNHFVLDTMLRRRHELATLLGYRSWADYQLGSTMAGSPEAAREFLNEVRRITEPELRSAIEAHRARTGQAGARTVSLSELLALEATEAGPLSGVGAAIRPYLPYARVRDGLFDLARELLDLEFRAAPEIPVWHQTVEPYRVFDKGKMIAIVYLDLHWRPGKPAMGAAASTIRAGVRDRTILEGALIGGMVRPMGSEPGLLGPRPMQTMFHEFGHLFHMLLSQRSWFTTSGLPNDFDFREVPSTIFEAWATDSAIVSRFARHYQTGEPAPPALLARLRIPPAAGGIMGQFVSRMSLDLHDKPPGDMHELVRQAFRESIPPDLPYDIQYPDGDLHAEVALPHLGTYEAAYYTYLWSDVIAADLLTRFKGLRDRDAMQAYRREILEPGRSKTAKEMVEAFLGRPVSLEAWTRQRASRMMPR